MLKAVTFDLGDTLIDYGPMRYGPMMAYGVRRAWEYLESLEPGCRSRGGAAAEGPSFSDFSRRLRRVVRRTWCRSKFLVQDRDAEPVIAQALADLGIALDDDRRREFVRRFFAALQQMAGAMPGAVEAVAHLAGAGLGLAIVSNTVLPPWFLDESLEAVGLLGYFPLRFYSCAVGSKKPQRRIFAQALAALEVRPAEALHVGDRYLTDILGARRAGLRTCLKVGYRSLPLPPVRPDYRIRHLRELVPLVDFLRTEGR